MRHNINTGLERKTERERDREREGGGGRVCMCALLLFHRLQRTAALQM